ncbi:hypothetical protein [Crocosphaera chwakensis]|uniref:Uncharacterized protein n=1 Tax=Crocosphaera chwakensis CCY0110 TaxID=391612 RepID=A3IGS0_9CHRO|nr:hypothetical protein [Crocosphaera chwakensis]EAZ94162.1 hypothetical protein CY0110_09817 [Crocosphaera chwakensis CCY0110]
MIKKVPLILLLSYVALTSGGCSLFQSGQDSSEEPPVAESPESPETPEENPDEVFEDPESTPSPPQVSASQGLLPSTPPSERRKNIQTGRDNPFAVIPIKPVVRQTTSSNGSNQNGFAQNGVAANGVAPPEQLCTLEQRPVATVAQAPGSATPVSDVGPAPLLAPVLPIPNEARGVEVSGVMQLSGTPVAIVKAPNENVARQVRVGGTLSNGQVRVKAINVSSQRPYVILEQYGLEIPRGLGEPPEEPIDPPTPSTPSAPSIAPPDPANPDGFGIVNNLMLQQVELAGEDTSNPLVNGTLCNNGNETLKVSTLTLQIAEKGTNKVINSMKVELAATYTLTPGIQAEFDGRVGADDNSQKSELGLRGRNKEDVTITLTDWS